MSQFLSLLLGALVFTAGCVSRNPASEGSATVVAPQAPIEIKPPPPFRVIQAGVAPPVIDSLELDPREREFATILLDGSFLDDDARVAAYDRLINRLSELPKGELFDLYQNRWKPGALQKKSPIQGIFTSIAEDPELSLEMKSQFSGLIDEILRQVGQPVASTGVSGLTSDYVTAKALEKARLVGRSGKVTIVKKFEPVFQKAIGDTEQMVKFIVDSGKINIGDKAYDTMFKTVLVEYFKNLKFENKKAIIRDLLELPGNADFYDRLAALFQNAGPQFQKIMQALARNPDVGPELGAILSRLEAGVKTAPFSQIHKSLLAAIPEHYPKDFVSIEYEPIGSGTMAQIHRAEIRMADGEKRIVVVRVLKPWAAQRLKEDGEIFDKIIPMIENHPDSKGTELEKFRTFAEGFQRAAIDEMNAEITSANQQKAMRIYPRLFKIKKADVRANLRVVVPAVIDLGGKKSSTVLIQELAPGVSMTKFFQFDPATRKIVSESLAEMWVKEAVFGSGFFHSDLHQGNVLVDRGIDGSVNLSLLDFGMIGEITPEQRGAFLRLSGAIASKDSNEAVNSIGLLLREPIDVGLLRTAVKEGMAKPNASVPELIKSVVKIGGEFPDAFTAFNRGNLLVSQMLLWAGSKQTVDTLAWDLAVKGMMRELPTRALQILKFDFKTRGDQLAVNNRELFHMFKSLAQAKCSELFDAVFSRFKFSRK